MKDLLAKHSTILGNDITAIQGAGGNVSCKSGDTMYIKASGTWLAEAQAKNIFTTVSVEAVLETLSNDGEVFHSLKPNEGLRPSIETPLHALMPQAVVLHVHCVHTIARSIRQNYERELGNVLQEFFWAFVPYARPGLPLAQAVQSCLKASVEQIDILVLGNHGLIVAGDDIESTFFKLANVRKSIYLQEPSAPDYDRPFLVSINDDNWVIPEKKLLHSIATDSNSLHIASQGVLFPDQVVFLGPFLPVANEWESVSEASSRLGEIMGGQPKYVVYPGKGMVLSPSAGQATLAMLEALALVCGCFPEPVKINTLTEADVYSLTNWDAEKYRQTLEAMRGV